MQIMASHEPYNLHVDLQDQAVLNFSAEDFGLKLTNGAGKTRRISLKHNTVSGILYSAVMERSGVLCTLEFKTDEKLSVKLIGPEIRGGTVFFEIGPAAD
jgi:hypothetical protein